MSLGRGQSSTPVFILHFRFNKRGSLLKAKLPYQWPFSLNSSSPCSAAKQRYFFATHSNSAMSFSEYDRFEVERQLGK